MAKKKSNKKNTLALDYKKIGIIGGIFIILCLVVLVFVLATANKFYECTEYDWYEKFNSEEIKTSDGMGEIYDFYRLFLEDDNKFILKYRLKDGTMIYTDKGTYEKTDTQLILTYDSTNPSQELTQVCTYEIDGNTITRDELVEAPDGTRVRVKQTFVLK